MHLFGHAGPISLRTECFRDEVRRIPQPGHTLRPAETASQFPFIHLRPFLQGFSRAGVCHRGLLRIRQKVTVRTFKLPRTSQSDRPQLSGHRSRTPQTPQTERGRQRIPLRHDVVRRTACAAPVPESGTPIKKAGFTADPFLMKKIALLLYPVTGLFQSVFLRLHLFLLHALTRDFYDSHTVLVVLGKRLHGVALIFGSNDRATHPGLH